VRDVKNTGGLGGFQFLIPAIGNESKFITFAGGK
jgi:hypothetical protein